MSTKLETHKLDADIGQLFELITKSFYSDKQIFLRELVSNSADALQKKKILLASNDKIKADPSTELRIDIIPSLPDSLEKILVIKDNGCGMTHDELIKNLSTIAHSGTKDFVRAATEGLSDISMIGQFGVGFYSAFLVSDRIELKTFSITEVDSQKGYIWKSSGKDGYTIEEIQRTESDPISGTEIKLYLKEDCKEFCDPETIQKIVKKYNSFASQNVYLHMEKEVDEPLTEEEIQQQQKEEEKEEGDAKVEEVKDEEEKEKEEEKAKTKKVKKMVEEKLNTLNAIWRMNKNEVTEEQYEEFYKSLSKDWEKHLAVQHFKVEGQGVEFSAVLFIPSRAPFDLFDSGKKKKKISLHVKGVFIMDNCEDFIPDYLNFMVGIIDSEHLDLNVSREILQKSEVSKQIKRVVVKKCIELFKDIEKKDPEKFNKFLEQFGKNIKLGVHEDSTNRETLAGFLRFDSTKRDRISLDEYIESIPDKFTEEEKKNIFYISAESKKAAENSPFLEGFKKNKVEVLYLTETIDEYVAAQLKEYKGKKLVNITKAGVKVPTGKADEKTEEEQKKETESEKKIIESVKKVLENEVEKVVKVEHLEYSPASVASTEYGWSANFERIMKNQALKDTTMHQFMMGKKVLGLNMKHPIVKKLGEMESEGEEFKKCVRTIFELACLNCGFSIEDKVSGLVKNVYEMMGKNLGVDMSEVAERYEEEDKGNGKVEEVGEEEQTEKVQEID